MGKHRTGLSIKLRELFGNFSCGGVRGLSNADIANVFHASFLIECFFINDIFIMSETNSSLLNLSARTSIMRFFLDESSAVVSQLGSTMFWFIHIAVPSIKLGCITGIYG